MTSAALHFGFSPVAAAESSLQERKARHEGRARRAAVGYPPRRRPIASVSQLDSHRQKHLVLILAREFASNLSTPTLIADARGFLVYYNEAAESVVGRRFSEAGEMPLENWLADFDARTLAGEPLPPEERPARVAFAERRATHLRYIVTSADGIEREIEVTAFPLFAHTDEFVGVVVIFWRD